MGLTIYIFGATEQLARINRNGIRIHPLAVVELDGRELDKIR